MYDYVVAALRCPNCNTVSAADSSTNMQTHIRDDAAGSETQSLFAHFSMPHCGILRR